MWDMVENIFEISNILIEGAYQSKVKSLWIEERKKRYLLTFKVKWIIINSLTLTKHENISNCTTTKEV